jgi:hypothetical protein
MISLDGHFKADVYNQNDELISSGDWAGNFITSTGLCYPLTMPFANTFMYLSLGSGKQPSDLYTTGLRSGSQPYIYTNDGPHPAKYNFLWTTGIVAGGCGYISHSSGVELFRAWRIPEQPGQYLAEDFHVSELMCSPATTGGMGISGTSYPDPFAGGKFSDPSSGRSAFNRVLKDFTLPSGDYGVITYKLNFIVDKEVRSFEPFVGLNNAAGAGKTTWQQLTGKARIMHPGIQLIKKQEADSGGGGGGGGGGDDDVPGEAFKLKYGAPLEPSTTGNMYAYFTTDNTQFRFNPFWGGAGVTGLQKLIHPSNGTLHWNTTGVNFATGFAEYFHNLADLTEMTDQEGGEAAAFPPKSIPDLVTNKTRLNRFKQFRRVKSNLPSPTNFTEEFQASAMGQAGFNDQVIVTSLNHDIAISYTGQTDHSRGRDMTRVLGWQTVNAVGDPGSPGTWISYKSLVFCADNLEHRDTLPELTDDVYAFFDSQFGTYDSTNHPQGGEYLASITSTGQWPYGQDDGKPTFGQSSDAYPYHDNQNGLSMTWQLTWSSPCGEVAGACSDGISITKTACQTAGETWLDCIDP